MSDFFNKMEATLNNVGYTENGAQVYKSTKNSLVDLNYFSSSFRALGEDFILNYWKSAWRDDALLATKWLFFARDVRAGMGERRAFRIIMKHIANEFPHIAAAYLEQIPFYGRWDDLVDLIDTPVVNQVIAVIKKQLKDDLLNAEHPETHCKVSLLAKWLPSTNASEKSAREAYVIRKGLFMSEKAYRKTLSKLRKILNVIEVKMSANDWSHIDYEAVPSIANVRYTKCFLKHDEERRRQYLSALERGEAKINASVTFPHMIISQLRNDPYSNNAAAYEGMWKALPNLCPDGISNTLVVCDGSGSMMTQVPGSASRAMDVSYALSIYFSEKLTGAFKDKFITFSSCPQLIDLSRATSLRQKYEILHRYNDCSNTNLEAVFNLVLTTAIENHLTQDELPQQLLIVSDGEFDSMVDNTSVNMFTAIAEKFRRHGYQLPRLVFWNVMNRSMTIPVTENENGVALVSGFSPNIIKMILSQKTDPFDVLLEQLNSERYAKIEEIWDTITAVPG